MEIKIFKGDKEIKVLPLELEHISPKFLSQNFAEIRNIEALEKMQQELIENEEKIKKDLGESAPISLIDEKSVKIPFKIFFSELTNTLDRLIQIYKDGGVEIVIE